MPLSRNQRLGLGDTARVDHPEHGFEHRLGTVTDFRLDSFTTWIHWYRLRFPTGDERTYTPDKITACGRDDDHAALITHLDAAFRSLAAACRIGHDYGDDELSAEIFFHTASLIDSARLRLRVTLDPARLVDLGTAADPAAVGSAAPAPDGDRS
ncbi:hypothetical protein [Couchioplanes caeruleus]|uniref:Uncharacterized protein n=2 Tax=Couchioplanes caeruleus TaxID=56438 RepID=A0A1K0FJY5_9ACTN|nr:hypothetical protein [Couchioplanes caeruleus]OJF13137.1 hypothetical protein BG844_16830 [Couchioplanes caeruleus subsp. caeruleus]ROP28111.1 hypothetical protein EDD30_0820 [Couchioplanes caeruleus]